MDVGMTWEYGIGTAEQWIKEGKAAIHWIRLFRYCWWAKAVR
jgi:hypothetical protein